MAQKHKSFSGFINIVDIPYSPNPTVSSIGLTEKKYCWWMNKVNPGIFSY